MTHVFSQCVDCHQPFALFDLVAITADGWQHERPCTPQRQAETGEVGGA